MILVTMGSALAVPQFHTDIIGPNAPAIAGKEYQIQVRVCNAGDSGSMKVETGIYTKDTLNDWYNSNLFALFPLDASDYLIPNCEGYQTNVETASIELDAGMCEDVAFDIKTPTDWNLDYGIHTNAFERCYKDAPGNTGQSDYDVESVDVEKGFFNNVIPSATCSDGIRNQDETDTDVGGVCGVAPDYYECRFDSDCQSTSVCVDNGLGELICVPKTGSKVPTEDPLPTPEQTTPDTPLSELTGRTGVPNDEPNREIVSQNELVAPKDESRFKTIPIVNKRNAGNGEELIVTVQFFAEKDGVYLLEAGVGKVKELPLAVSVTGNLCDPGTPEFANSKVELNAGIHEIDFSVGARDDGDYAFWVAYVNDCGNVDGGGKILHHVLGDGLIAVGVRDDGVGETFDFRGLLGGAGLIALVFVLLAGLWIWALRSK